MSEEKNKKSSSHQREVTAYLRPAIMGKLEKYVAEKEVTKSEVINEALKSFLEPYYTSAVAPQK